MNDCIPVFIEDMDQYETRKLLEMCANALSPQNWNGQFTEDLLDHLPDESGDSKCNTQFSTPEAVKSQDFLLIRLYTRVGKLHDAFAQE